MSWLFSEPGQTFVQNVIAAVAVLLAARGVRNWGLERRDLRRAELAEKSLEATYRLRDIISVVRSPFGSSEKEGSSRKRDEGETDELRGQRDHAFVPIERLSTHVSKFEELQTLRYSVSAAFGKEAASLFDEFFKVRSEIIVAARMNYRVGVRDPDVELQRRLEAVIWEGTEDPDKIVARLDQAIERLEKRFRPYVEARFRAPGFFWWR